MPPLRHIGGVVANHDPRRRFIEHGEKWDLGNIIKMAVGPEDELYVMGDSQVHSAIYKITRDGKLVHVAGNDVGEDTGTKGVERSFPNWCDFCVGSDGSLYVSDATSRIIRIMPDNSSIVFAGDPKSSDVTAYANDEAPKIATECSLGWPSSVAISPSGRFFFLDAAYGRLFEIDSSSHVHLIASSKESTPIGNLINDHLHVRLTIRCGAEDMLYFSDPSSQYLHCLNLLDGSLSLVAGNDELGQQEGAGPAINTPTGRIASFYPDQEGNVYMIESSTQESRLIRIEKSGYLCGVFSDQDYEYEEKEITGLEWSHPWCVCVSPSGAVYVADGRSVFQIEAPHERELALVKLGWDDIDGIVACRYVLERLSPSLHQAVSKKDGHSPLRVRLLQDLIDYIMYGQKAPYCIASPLVDLLILLAELADDIFDKLKNTLLHRFIKLVKTNILTKEDLSELVSTISPYSTNSPLLSWMIDYATYSFSLRRSGGDSSTSREPPISRALTSLVNDGVDADEISDTATEVDMISLFVDSDERFYYGPCFSQKSGVLASLLASTEHCDCDIEIAERSYGCHRSILSSYSNYFRKLLEGNFGENQPPSGGSKKAYTINTAEDLRESRGHHFVPTGAMHRLIIAYCYGFVDPLSLVDDETDKFLEACGYYDIQSVNRDYAKRLCIYKDNCLNTITRFGSSDPLMTRRLATFIIFKMRDLIRNEESLRELPDDLVRELVIQQSKDIYFN